MTILALTCSYEAVRAFFYTAIFLILAACQQPVAAQKPNIETAKNNDEATLKLVRSHLETYDEPKAQELLDKIKNKENEDYLNFSGVCADIRAEPAKAQEFYNAALKLAPDDEAIRNNLALSYIMAGDPFKGIEILEKLVKSPYTNQKNLSKYRHNLALGYAMTNKNSLAFQNLVKDLPPQAAKENLLFYKALKKGQ